MGTHNQSQSTPGRATTARLLIRLIVSLLGTACLAPLPAANTGALLPMRDSSQSIEPSVFDFQVKDTTVSAVITWLRLHQCAPVSFITAPGDQRIHRDFRRVTVAELLREVAERDPSYRYERIAGRDILYPADPEFQTVLDGVSIKSMRRFDAVDKYVPILRSKVPGLNRLVEPPMVGNFGARLFTEPVSLRQNGRVIEHFVDLLGANKRAYFEFVTAPSGQPELLFAETKCEPIVPPVSFTSCFASTASPPAAELLERRISIDTADEPVGSIIDRLRKSERLPLSFVEDSAARRVNEHLHDVTTRTALKALVTGLPGYRCLVGNGNVIVVADDPAYQVRLSGVKVVRESSWIAAGMYVGRLLKEPALRRLIVSVDRPEDPVLRSNEVSLAKEGTVLEHLVQLLGDDPSAFFSVRRPPGGERTLSLGRISDEESKPIPAPQ